MLIAAQMWDDTDDDAVLQELAEILNTTKTGVLMLCIELPTSLTMPILPEQSALGLAPLHVLRPIFFYLRNNGKLNLLHSRVLETLRPHLVDHPMNVSILPWAGDLIPEMRHEFRSSLARYLFGWDILLSLRMRLSVADFVWVSVFYITHIRIPGQVMDGNRNIRMTNKSGSNVAMSRSPFWKRYHIMS